MKTKKILIGISVLAVVAVAMWNMSFGSQIKGMSDVMLANVEALAGCESSVETKRGIEAELTCPMEGGGSATFTGCEFDNAYKTTACTGRPWN